MRAAGVKTDFAILEIGYADGGTSLSLDGNGLSMASKRNHFNEKSKSKTSAPAPVERFAVFGPPPLLEGEDRALYDDLLGRMCAAVKPVDVIDELLVADVVYSEWDIIRWRSVKFSLLQASVHHKLGHFLNERLNYEAYREAFAEALAEILPELLPNLAEGQARELAHQYARSQPDAIKKVGVVLKAAELDPDEILDQTKAERAEDLVKEYARHEPEAVKLVNELLASSGQTARDLMLEALSTKLGEIEPIDRLITIAETRRNISLREIDRRRAVHGEALRRKIEEVEGEFEIVETTPGNGEPACLRAHLESRPAKRTEVQIVSH